MADSENFSFFDIVEQFLEEELEGLNSTKISVIEENHVSTIKVSLYIISYSINIFHYIQYVVAGILMFSIGCIGVFFNLISFVFYIRQKCHKTFHR